MVERVFGMDKWYFKRINTPFEYSLKTQINLIFTLNGLHNSIKDHPSQDIHYFEVKCNDVVTWSSHLIWYKNSSE